MSKHQIGTEEKAKWRRTKKVSSDWIHTFQQAFPKPPAGSWTCHWCPHLTAWPQPAGNPGVFAWVPWSVRKGGWADTDCFTSQRRLPRVVNACLKFIDKESEISKHFAKGQLGREHQACLSLKSPLLQVVYNLLLMLGKVWARESRLWGFSLIDRAGSGVGHWPFDLRFFLGQLWGWI